MDSAIRVAFEEVTPVEDAYERCSGVCFVGLTKQGKMGAPLKYFDETQFRCVV